MDAILKFQLPEEGKEYETAVNGLKYKLVLFDLSEHMFRLEEMFEHEEDCPDAVKKLVLLKEIREKLNNALAIRKVCIYD